jgi:hypothetical protein
MLTFHEGSLREDGNDIAFCEFRIQSADKDVGRI